MPITQIKTSNFTVDDSGAPEPITTTIKCRRIVVKPADGASSYKFRSPLATSDAITRQAGTETVITRPAPGQYQQGLYGDPGYYDSDMTVGYLETLSGEGAKTFEMEEYL